MRYFVIALLAASLAFPALSEPESNNTTGTAASDDGLNPTPTQQTVGYDAKAKRDANGNLITEDKSAPTAEAPAAMRNDRHLRNDRDMLNNKR